MITIIDYKMGNIRSIQSALSFLGEDSQVSNSPEVIANSAKLILPGVGSFRTAMKNLSELGLIDPLHRAVLIRKVPVLGICLGMQLLADEGSEDGITQGLGWIPGKVVRFELSDSNYRVPHIGFNTVYVNCANKSLFKDVENSIDFYFVHSYHLQCDDDYVSGWSDYNGRFVAAVQRENVFGTQFHPEKSQSNGLIVLRNFIKMNATYA